MLILVPLGMYWRHPADLVHPRDGHRKILLMIDAYLDESGIHEGAAVCVISGYFGGRGQWRKLEILWRQILKKAGYALEDFHANKWVKNEAKYGSVLDDLARATTQYKIYPVSVGVVVADFFSFSEEDRRFLTGATLMPSGKLKGTGSPNQAYFLPFTHVIKTVSSYAPVGGKAHFFFGVDKQLYGYANELFKKLWNDPLAPFRERIGTVAAPLAKETPPLQAADLLAHLTYVDLQDRLANNTWDQQLPQRLVTCLGRARMREDFVYYNKMCIELSLRNPQLDPDVGKR